MFWKKNKNLGNGLWARIILSKWSSNGQYFDHMAFDKDIF